jgi:hypothetical protein
LWALILAGALCASCATTADQGGTLSGGDDEYEKLGLSRIHVEKWEDGMRTSGAKGSYEWWYFDSKLADGSTVVIVFYTKIMLEVQKGLDPVVSVTVSNPDGSKAFSRTFRGKPADFSASRESCDVRIGRNSFSGDLSEYRIVLDFDDVRGDILLSSEAPAWRPGTGHSYFSDGKKTNFFAWLPSVPRGRTSGSLSVGGRTIGLAGSGYHDHNWGDASIADQMHDWYWGRAEAGPYTVISSFITASARYGGGQGSSFVLFKDGKALAQDGAYVKCSLEDVYADKETGKPVANVVRYDYDDGASRYRVTYRRERDIEKAKFADALGGFMGFLAKLSGFDGAYLRFAGKVTVERFEGGEVAESASQDDAVWELMYLGRAPKAK